MLLEKCRLFWLAQRAVTGPNAAVTFSATPCIGQRDRADRDRALGHHSQRCCSPPFVVVAQADGEPPRKRQRTSEDFISFCKFILEYENYESIKQEELQEKDAVSPSDSSADSVDSVKQEDSEQGERPLRVSPTLDADRMRPMRAPSSFCPVFEAHIRQPASHKVRRPSSGFNGGTNFRGLGAVSAPHFSIRGRCGRPRLDLHCCGFFPQPLAVAKLLTRTYAW